MKNKEICWNLLTEVSRSFDLAIRILPAPLNEQLMISYLVFRVIDTIEDSNAPIKTKKRLFDLFLKLLYQNKFSLQDTKRLSKNLLTNLNYTYEKNLLKNLNSVLKIFFSQPKEVRLIIRRWARVMTYGMYKFQKKKIQTISDQNKYSFYVAGVVGYLFNDLLYINKIITKKIKQKIKQYAKEFGIALQKINILRDVARDLASNRYFWPKKLLEKYNLNYKTLCNRENRELAVKVLSKQINNVRRYLYSAIKYVLNLPKNALRVRMFCLIPLFMAIESYVKCINDYGIFEIEKIVKIEREKVYEIIFKSKLWGSDNEKVFKWFLQAIVKISPDFVREEYIRSIRPYIN